MSAAYKCDKCSQYKDGAPAVAVAFVAANNSGQPWCDPLGVCMPCAQEMATSKERVEQNKQSARLREEAAAKTGKATKQ